MTNKNMISESNVSRILLISSESNLTFYLRTDNNVFYSVK